MSVTTQLGTFFQQVLTAVKTDVIKDALPVINAFLVSIEKNPSQANVVAQAMAFEVNLLAALPNLQVDVTKDVATLVQTELNTLLAAEAAKPA